jgi:hypothetical protein
MQRHFGRSRQCLRVFYMYRRYISTVYKEYS